MKKIIATLGVSVLLALGVSPSADAQAPAKAHAQAPAKVKAKAPAKAKAQEHRKKRKTCTGPLTRVGDTVSWNGPAGFGNHVWRMWTTAQECTGYDLITKVQMKLDKQSIGCSVVSGSGFIYMDNYRFNPNSFGSAGGGANPGGKQLSCVQGQSEYLTTWNYPNGIVISSGMTGAQRCIGGVAVAQTTQATGQFDVPSICYDGV